MTVFTHGLQELVQVSRGINGDYNRHTGNTTENSGVAAEAAELGAQYCLLLFTVPFGAFLFRAQSTLSSVSSRTKH